MKKFFVKKGILTAIYIVFAVMIEIITFSVLKMGVLPVYWGLDFALIVGISIVLFILPSSKATIWIASIFLTLQAVLGIVNEALMTMSGIVFGLTMLNLTKELGGVFNSDFVNWWLFAGLLLLAIVAIVSMIVVQKKVHAPKTRLNRNTVIALLLCCLIGENASLLCYQLTVNSFNKAIAYDELSYYNDDRYLYDTQFISAKALKKFGTFGFYFVNVSNAMDRLLFGPEKSLSASEEEQFAYLDSYFAEGEMSETVYGNSIYTGALQGRNIVLIVLESGEWSGINKEYTPTLYALATQGIAFTEYYCRDKTNHSEAMGILGSYPVRSTPYSDLEDSTLSFSLPNALRRQNYTTHYFHANKGSFYHRDVTHGEEGCYGFDSAYFPEDLPALKGYDNPNKNFYDFDLDQDLMRYYTPEYTEIAEGDEAFFTMHMTLSSHGHYDDLLEEDYTKDLTEEEKEDLRDNLVVKGLESYYEMIDGYPKTYVYPSHAVDEEHIEETYSSGQAQDIYRRFKRYQAGVMDLDEGINILMKNLQAQGQLDNTTFFFYADHSGYYNNQNYYLKGIKEGMSYNSRVYNIPCFLWDGGTMDAMIEPNDRTDGYFTIVHQGDSDPTNPLHQVKGQPWTKYGNSFDIVPTLLHLVGYDYNLNLYQGVSMFSEEESVFVSRESGIFTDEFYFDGMWLSVKNADGTWTQYDYETLPFTDGYTEEMKEFLRKSYVYYTKQEYLEAMYQCDYFSRRNIEKSYKGTRYMTFVGRK